MRNPKWHRDEIILALDLYFDPNRGSIEASNLKLIELSEILNSLPIIEFKPDIEKFRNPNGICLKLSNFLAIDPEYKGKGMQAYSILDKQIFEEFQNDKLKLHNIANEIKSIARNPEISQKIVKIEDDDCMQFAKEGQILYKMHKVRERDRKIIKTKKLKVMKEKGKLECEACHFDFKRIYGVLGLGFIECHHLVPLSKLDGPTETKLDDLALVCSNCHRMLHRDLSISSIEQFKLLINSLAKN